MANKRNRDSSTKSDATKSRSHESDFGSLFSDNSFLVDAGATEQEIASVGTQIKLDLPSSLTDFLRWRDGGMFAAKRFIIFSAGKGLHPHETLVAANSNQDHPLLNIGRDATFDFGFKKGDLSKPDPPVYSYFYETGETDLVAKSFTEWIQWAEKIAANS